MNSHTHYSLSSLIHHAESFIDEVDTVSFDVFDTLFIRRIENPDIVKIPVSRHIERTAKQFGIESLTMHNLHVRNLVEIEHRKRNGANGPDEEANYDHFMPEVLKRLLGDHMPQDYFKTIAAYETKIENSVLVVRKELIDWIETLHKRGKKLLLISDMYLPAHYIRSFVEDKKIDHYFSDIISSADSLQAKASGSAYPLVQQKHQLDKDKWLHVGDHPFSDGLRALDFGIKALIINDPKEKHRKKLSKKYNLFAAKTNFWKGRNVFQVMLPLEAEVSNHPALYNDGHNFFGYLFGFYMQRLAEKCQQQQIKKIYFCAREGWLLKKCWELCAPHFFNHQAPPEVHYLYVSRMALAKAMCANTGLSQQVVSIIFLPASNKTFSDLSRVFGLDIESLRHFLNRYELDEHMIVSPHDYDNEKPNEVDIQLRFRDLLHDIEFQNAIKQQTRHYRDAYNQYLEQEGFFEDDDVAIVDIGWLGTIQTFFSHSISHRKDLPHIHGFMLAATRYVDYPQSPRNYFEGLIFDSHRFDVAASVVEYIRDIFEEVSRAPHPTLMSVKIDKTGLAVPVFRQTDDAVGQNEIQQSQLFEPVQEGIFDGVKAYARAIELFGYQSGEVRPFLNLVLLRRIAFAKTDEIERLKLIEHVDDFGGNQTEQVTPKKPEYLWDFSIKQLKYSPFLRLRRYLQFARAKFRNHF